MLETYVLHLTKKCNMKCLYCYETDKTSTYTWDEIKITIDNIVKHNKHFVLEFLGGEPCLEMGLMGHVVSYLEDMDDVRVEKYIITTNGTIINQELIDLLTNNPTVVWCASIDGSRFMNCLRLMSNNINSFETVIDNFKGLSEAIGSDTKQLGCHMTIHPYNVGYYNNGVSTLYKHGFRSIDVGIVESTMVIDDLFCDNFINQNKELSDRMHNGEYPNLRFGLFESITDGDDKRHYIKDDSGKVILETYGRYDGDIKDSDEYKTPSSSSPLGTLIHDIKKEVYDYHNR